MSFIVYKTTNLVNGKFYVGVHKTDNIEIFDGYFGSGSLLKLAIKKHGKENFIRETLFDCLDDQEEAYSIEKILVKTKDQDPRAYNIKQGGFFIPMHMYVIHTKEKLSEYGTLGGNKCKEESIGFHSMSVDEMKASRLIGTLNGMKNNVGIHTTDNEKRSEWASKGGAKSLGCRFYNNGKSNNKFNATRSNISFEEFLIQNSQYVAGKIFVNKNTKLNSITNNFQGE